MPWRCTAIYGNFPVDLKKKTALREINEYTVDIENNIYWLKAAFPWEIQMPNTKKKTLPLVITAKHKFRDKNMHA